MHDSYEKYVVHGKVRCGAAITMLIHNIIVRREDRPGFLTINPFEERSTNENTT